MSIRALTATAVQRDTGSPRKPGRTRKPAGEPVSAAESPPQTATDALISSVPTEILAPYTVLIGVILSLAAQPDDYLPLRWVLYSLTAVLVAVAVVVMYYRKSAPGTRRQFPALEVAVGFLAFVAWGLAMPGSPLQAGIDDDTARGITSAIVAFAGAIVVGLFGVPLTKPTAKTLERQGQ